jgi:hypothetical protein
MVVPPRANGGRWVASDAVMGSRRGLSVGGAFVGATLRVSVGSTPGDEQRVYGMFAAAVGSIRCGIAVFLVWTLCFGPGCGWT